MRWYPVGEGAVRGGEGDEGWARRRLARRPAAQFVKAAKGFSSEIVVLKGEEGGQRQELIEDHDVGSQEE